MPPPAPVDIIAVQVLVCVVVVILLCVATAKLRLGSPSEDLRMPLEFLSAVLWLMALWKICEMICFTVEKVLK